MIHCQLQVVTVFLNRNTVLMPVCTSHVMWQTPGMATRNTFGGVNSNHAFKQYMEWLDSYNFKQIIDKVDTPNLDFISLTNDRIKMSFLENEDVNYTYMNQTADGFKESVWPIPSNDPEQSANGNYATFGGRVHCIIMPYYIKVDGVKGCDEKTLGQTNAKTVASNNIMIIF